jgi:hypothetical protein
MVWITSSIDKASVASPLETISAPQNEAKGSVGEERIAVIARGLVFAQVLVSTRLIAKDQGQILARVRAAAHVLSVLHPRKASGSIVTTADNHFWPAPRHSFVH